MKMRIAWLAVVSCVLGSPLLSHACSIPVFRYALERWELGPYEVICFHRGELTSDDKANLKRLQEPSPRANVALLDIDLDGEVPKGYQQFWERFAGKETKPLLMVRKLDSDLKTAPIWTGTLDADNVQKILESPARRQLVRRLSGGDSTVFLLLESGNKTADDAAAQMLERELANLRERIELPEQSTEGPQLRFALPLRVGFTVVRINRKDPQEEVFIPMLLNSEDELLTVTGPIAFPVFGRGRLLCSLQGTDLAKENLTSVVRFLCGACSCQVKELNPGVDLLIAADWLEILESLSVNADLTEQITRPVLAGLEFFDDKQTLLVRAARQNLAKWNESVTTTVKEPQVERDNPPKRDAAPTAEVPASPPETTTTTPEALPCGTHDECPLAANRRSILWIGAGLSLIMVVFAAIWVGRGS